MKNVESRLLECIRAFYGDVRGILDIFKGLNPFELLISTIISQNTNWKNVERAMANLRNEKLLSIDEVLKADIGVLERALRVAGLYRVKAVRIKEIAGRLKSWGLSLEDILSLDPQDARAKLMELPAVGYKTADILLTFKADVPVIPIDTHIERVAKRLGLVGRNAGYEEIRRRLESFVPPNERALFHLALIKFGREICRARNPACDVCPLSDVCSSSSVKP